MSTIHHSSNLFLLHYTKPKITRSPIFEQRKLSPLKTENPNFDVYIYKCKIMQTCVTFMTN